MASRHFYLDLYKYTMHRGDVSLWHTNVVLNEFNKFFGLGFIFWIIGQLPNEVIVRPLFIPFL
jgi:hypothetical protein